jgi:hypothetical protein
MLGCSTGVVLKYQNILTSPHAEHTRITTGRRRICTGYHRHIHEVLYYECADVLLVRP